MDSAEQIFENFLKGGYQYLCQVRDEKRIETELIDYKTIKNNASPLSSDDRSTLSKALSGFANSGGGIIVWGVDCRLTKGVDEPDCVKELKPIKGLKRLLSDLNTHSPGVVDGSIIGVRHEPLEEVKGSDTGFAFTYVPKGESLPHQAQDKAFYYRSGSTFQKMPTWMVVDRMRRAESPALEFRCVAERAPFQNDPRKLLITIEVFNSGTVAANNVSTILNVSNTKFCEQFGLPRYLSNFNLWHDGRGILKIGAKPGLILFPAFGIAIASFLLDARDEESATEIRYRLQCDGFRAEDTLTVIAGDLINEVEYSEAIALASLENT